MGMKFASKINGTLAVKSQLFELIKVVLSITRPANTQKDGMQRDSFSTYGKQVQFNRQLRPPDKGALSQV
eukprot:755468-Pelagomonas_calceolata.AAC.8